MRGLNNRLLELHGAIQQAEPSEAAALRNEAAPLMARRAAALQLLIETNPAEALKFAYSPELASQMAALFPEQAGRLERWGTWQGPVEYLVEDDVAMKRHRTIRRIKVGTEDLQLSFSGQEPAGLKTGDLLRVSGIRSGNNLVTTMATIEGTASAAATCSTTGVQNTAVLLVTFPGVTVPATVTPQSVHDTFFGMAGHSLDGFWREASYGKASAAGDVFGWYTLDTAYTCAQGSQMRDAAIARAAAAGANFQNYTRVFVIYPNIGCTAGFAVVGCSTLTSPSGSFTASSAYIEADYMSGDQGVQLATHEGGHNLGLQHSGTVDFGTEVLGPLGATGTVDEFGDYWSTMGSQALGIYAAQHKAEVLNWLAPGTNYQVVQSSGVWSLQPLETNPPGLQALKVQRGTGNNAWLWVEYRQPIGNYDSTLMTQPFSGALIHYEDPTTGAFTHLLNFNPTGAWNTWWYPALVAGQTWVDPYTNLSISVQSATASALTVNVTYGSVPCTHANPTVSASPLNPSTYAGNGVGYNVLVTNNDSAGCSSNTFNLSSSQPSGWPTGFSATSLTLNPGQAGSVTMTKTPPAGTPAATYAVDARGTSGTFGGSAAANCTVMAAPALSVSVSVPSPTYGVRQTVPMSAVVLNGTSPAAGASVRFTLTQPGGSAATKTVTADSTGKAVWSYKLGAKGPLGVYSVTASATYNSQAATSNTATFKVQ